MNFPLAREIFRVAGAISLLSLAGCGIQEVGTAAAPVPASQQASVQKSPVIVVSTQTAESDPQATDLPTPTEAVATEFPPSSTIACPGVTCIWKLDQDPPELVSLEGVVETAYDYSPATQRVLHGRFTGRGAGPGNIAVSDLNFLDLNNGKSQQIISEENVAEAVWAPDGKNLAYVKVTPQTYELRWLTEFGEDRLLAADVAFTFSVSPNSEMVAFTRESNYKVPGQPGLYIVELDSSEEWAISDVDRQGAGSISDRPIWSPDGTQIILPLTGSFPPPGFVRAAVDGSRDTLLALNPSVQELVREGSIGSNLLWLPDNRGFVGQVYPDMLGSEPNRIVAFELDPVLEEIISADLVLEGEGELIGWAEPGESIWVWRGYSDLILVPLP